MSTKHYDIAIIGGSLSARIAAVLLAKHGKKVLFVRQREAMAPIWFHSSLFLENLLGVLGGRACFAAPKPIQIISRHARVTLQSDVPLEAELKREFGEAGNELLQFLNKLNELGVLLEEVFWENGGLPWPSLKGAARFRFLCMRRKLKPAEVETPITDFLADFPDKIRIFLTDLLQGLALMSVKQLTIGKAALLWTETNRPETLKEPDFSQTLSKRFTQFHGLKADLDDLQQLENDGKRWTGGHFKEGGRFEADTFLLGDRRWLDRFVADKSKTLPGAPRLAAYQLGDLTGQLSPLLTTRVICGGDQPMRMAIEAEDGASSGQLLTSGVTSEEAIRQQMHPILPFANYQLEPLTEADTEPASNSRMEETLTELPFLIGNNLYCADSTVLLPGLGAAGAAMVGWTLATHLNRASAKRPD